VVQQRDATAAKRMATKRGVAVVIVVTALLVIAANGLGAAPAALGQTTSPAGAVETSTAPVSPTGSPVTGAPVTGVAYGPSPEQVLDVHLPVGRGGPFPVIVYVHSGGWIGGSRSVIPDFILQQMDRAGIAVVSIDYRVTVKRPDGGIVDSFPVPDTDVDRAVRYVKANAATWGLDPTRVVLAGASAGGHLAALAAAAPGVFVDPTLPADLARVSPRVAGVIDVIGISDFTTFAAAGGMAPGLTTVFLDCRNSQVDECDRATVETASVATHLDAGAPPAFFAYGTADGLVVPATQGIPLADAWAEARGDASPPTRWTGSVVYDQTADGHTIDNSAVDQVALDSWLDATISAAGTDSGNGA
jgi:acetyl esterase/lipase